MEADMIALVEFCSYQNVEESFIASLNNSGLIELLVVDNKTYIPVSEISNIEKFIRMYYDLEINLEGIETICYLQKRLEEMNNELVVYKNRLRFYEDFE